MKGIFAVDGRNEWTINHNGTTVTAVTANNATTNANTTTAATNISTIDRLTVHKGA